MRSLILSFTVNTVNIQYKCNAQSCANLNESDDPKTRTPSRCSSMPVMSSVDYCNAVFAGSPRHITDKLQCVLNAAACLITGTLKFDHGLSHLLHEEMHWLDIPERIHYKLGVSALLSAVQGSWLPGRLLYTSWHHLWSATRYHLTVQPYRLSTFSPRTFSVIGLTVWNLLQDSVRDPALSSNSLRQSLKTNLFCRYHSAHTAQWRCFMTLCYINLLLRLTLTKQLSITHIHTAYFNSIIGFKYFNLLRLLPIFHV